MTRAKSNGGCILRFGLAQNVAGEWLDVRIGRWSQPVDATH
jgi:hypothetical protein